MTAYLSFFILLRSALSHELCAASSASGRSVASDIPTSSSKSPSSPELPPASSCAHSSMTSPSCCPWHLARSVCHKPSPDTSLFKIRLHSFIIKRPLRPCTATSGCDITADAPDSRNKHASHDEIQTERFAAKMAVLNFRKDFDFTSCCSSCCFCVSSILLKPEINGPRADVSHCCGFARYLVA